MITYNPHRANSIYQFILNFKQQTGGGSPTLREIGEAVGINSVSLTRYYLGKLEDDGRIKRPKGTKARLIMIPGETWTAPALIDLTLAGAEQPGEGMEMTRMAYGVRE